MAEDAGTIIAQIRLDLTQMEKDGLNAQQVMDKLGKKFQAQGNKGGKMYVNGFGQAQKQLNLRLNNMVSSLEGVSPKMGALGHKMAGVFSKPIFSMVPVVSAAFQAMLPVIGTIIAAVAGLIKIVSNAVKSQKEFNDSIKIANQAQEALAKSVKNAAAASQNQNDIEEKKSVAIAKVRLAFHNLFEPVRNAGKAVKDLTDKVFVFLLGQLDNITKALGTVMSTFLAFIPGVQAAGASLLAFSKSLKNVSDKDAKAAAEAKKLKGVNEELIKTAKAYEAQLENIATAKTLGAKTATEAANEEISATESCIDSLIKTRNVAAKLATDGEESEFVKKLDADIMELVGNLENLKQAAEFEIISGRELEIANEYENQLKQIALAESMGAVTREQAGKKHLSLLDSTIDGLVRVKAEMIEIHGLDSEAVKQIENRIRGLVGERERVDRLVTSYNRAASARSSMNTAISEEEKFLQERQKILDDFNRGMEHAAEMQRELGLSDEEHEQRVLRLREQQLSALDSLILKAGDVARKYKDTTGMIQAANTELRNQRERLAVADKWKVLEQIITDADIALKNFGKSERQLREERFTLMEADIQAEEEKIRQLLKERIALRDTGAVQLSAREQAIQLQKKEIEQLLKARTLNQLNRDEFYALRHLIQQAGGDYEKLAETITTALTNGTDLNAELRRVYRLSSSDADFAIRQINSIARARSANQLQEIQANLQRIGAIQNESEALEELHNQEIASRNNLEAMLRQLEQERMMKYLQDKEEMLSMVGEYQIKLLELQGDTEALKGIEEERVRAAIDDLRDLGVEMNILNKLFEEYQEAIKMKEEEEAAEKRKEKIDEIVGYISMSLDKVAELAASVGNFITAGIQKETKKRLESLDEYYNGENGLFKLLDEELQRRLYNMGLIEAKTEEQRENELAKAIESGDQRRIFEAETALKRFQTEEEFEKKKKALEDEMRGEKAKEEFRLEMAQWRSQLTQGYVSAAQGILNVISGIQNPVLWPPFIAAAATIGGLNLATIYKNKPVQTFSSGGIVAGNSFSGDQIWTRQNSGEMDLNMDQQRNLFNRIDNNDLGGGVTNITVITYLDGREIARNTASHFNNCEAVIKQRCIVR